MRTERLNIRLSRRKLLKGSATLTSGLSLALIVGCDDETQNPPFSSEIAVPIETIPAEEGLDVQFAIQLTGLINQFRQQNSLDPLGFHPALELAARDYSEILAKNDWFAHDSPDGLTPFDRMNSAGFSYNTYKGENLTKGGIWLKPEEIFKLLFDSKGHRANMLNPNYKFIGSACYVRKTSHFMRWCVQDFGGKIE